MSFLVSEADPINYEGSYTLASEQPDCEPTPQLVVEENYVENTTTNIIVPTIPVNKSGKNSLPLLFLGGALLVILAMQK